MERTTIFTKTQSRVVYNAHLMGRDCFVVPMTMLTPGVHAGSLGPLLYTAEELANTAHAWNHKPIVVYHPQHGKSACDPFTLNAQGVGVCLNSRFDKALCADAWLDIAQIGRIDPRIESAVLNRQMLELSTGLLMEVLWREGVWNGERYVGVATGCRADHVALLPDQKGACSVADGCGVFQSNCDCQADEAVGEQPLGLPTYNFGEKAVNSWPPPLPASGYGAGHGGIVEEPLQLPVYHFDNLASRHRNDYLRRP